jgi:hypothetical protein
MTLTLVTGRPNVGKSGLLYGPILEAAADGSPIVLLPSRPDARRAADEFSVRGVAGIRTVVLDEWIAELWSLHGDGRRLIESGVREALMLRACSETPLAAIASSAGRAGFVRALSSVAQRLTGTWSPEPRTAEDHEVLAVLERYACLGQEEGLLELGHAATILGGDPPRVEGPVAVNRFTDLSEPQEAFVSGLSTVTEVRIGLPWEQGCPATEALTPLVERLAESGEHLHIAAESGDDELDLLERNLYRPGVPHEPTGAVVFAEAAGEEAEAVLAVDLAAQLIAEGFEPGRIAIVFRDAAPRVSVIETGAVQAGVRVFMDVALPLQTTAIGKALLALLDVASGRDATRERMLAFLHSPYSGASPRDAEQLDTLWRRRRESGRRLLEDAASRLEGTAPAIRCARRVCGAPLTVENVKKWQELMDALLLAAESHRGLTGTAGKTDCAAHREVLRTLSALAGGISRGSGETAVREALCRVRVSPGGSQRDDEVLVTEVHRVRSRRFDAVILGGLTAAEFSSERPRSVAAELLERLGAAAGAEERASERLLFYTVVTRPRDRLVLLRQATDMIGEGLRPSVFWDEVLDLYRASAPLDEDEHPAGVPLVSRPLSTLADNSVCYSPGRRAKRRAGTRPEPRPARGILTSDEVRAAIRMQDEFSVSELERYATCPYRWFLDRAVRPRELDVAFEAREAGSVAHEALAAFYQRWAGPETQRRVVPDDLPEALRIADEVLDAAFESAPATIGLAEELAAERVRRWVAGVIEDDAYLLPGYTPVCHEFAFGGAEGRPFELSGVALRGRIDRIDACDRGLIVTDYKSAGVVPGHASFAGRGVIQLPVYLAAAVYLRGGEAHGAVYRSLSSRKVRGFWRTDRLSLLECGAHTDAVDAEGLESILAEAAERVRTASAGIRCGDIAPVTGGCDACGTCTARAMCKEARSR